MKICIIGFCNLNIMQYLYKYTNYLDERCIYYDVVYWNRLGIDERKGFKGNSISYDFPVNTYQSFYKKIIHFFRYALFLHKILKTNKYDKVIALTTQTAVLLYFPLVFKYKGRYIFDYRDITKEKKSRIYKKIVIDLIKNSFCTMMSSKGFADVLGIDNDVNVQFVHNTQTKKRSPYHVHLQQKNELNVVFWGIVRQIENNKRICDLFGRDKRFHLIFHGTGDTQKLSDYCTAKGYNNISFTGVYTRDEIPSFVKDTDIIHCIYENDDEQKPAMPVKVYDAIYYRLPVLISKGSFVEIFLSNAKGVYVVDFDNNKETDNIYSWYNDLVSNQVETSYKRLEDLIFDSDIAFEEKLEKFLV